MARTWIARLAGEGPFAQLAAGLSPSDTWSVMMEVAAERAAQRRPADVISQWTRDRFVTPAIVDQRTLRRVERVLHETAHAFEAIELSPLAPFGVCTALAPARQHKIVSTTRGTEVVSDPTNVMALVCADRLRADPAAHVRLCTSQRVVRAQPAPKRPGFSQHFSIFCLASAARARADHAALEALLFEHVSTHLASLEALRNDGWRVPPVAVRWLTVPALAHVAARLAARFDLPTETVPLENTYYDGGLRFMLNLVGDTAPIPLIDGGAFGWVGRLANNRRFLYVASGFGLQLVPLLFGPQ
jgi:hypothetical protein